MSSVNKSPKFDERLFDCDPYWWRDAPLQEGTEDALPKEADTVVVGSGFAGTSAARTLAAAGRDVVVLERGQIGQGASTRNGGAVGETLRISFSDMVQKFGGAKALSFYRGVRAARSFIVELIEQEAIDCDYVRCGRVICAHTRADYEALARDLEIRKRALDFEASMVPKDEMSRVIGSETYAGARVIHSDANLHPAKFHAGLVSAARRMGAVFFSSTEVLGLSHDGRRHHLVMTPRGTIAAREVVIATNGYTRNRFQWLARRIIPIQSQIIATEPLPRETLCRLVPEGRQMGDTRKLHNYWRISPDGTRLLFGGRAGASERSAARSALRLQAQMRDVYPELRDSAISRFWSGYIAYTFDALPRMGHHEGVHYIGGCCGSGVAMQPYLGDQTARKILKADRPDCPFDIDYATMPGYFGKPWFLPAVIGAYGLIDRSKRLFQQGRREQP